MLEDTLSEPDSLKLKLDECFKHLKEYFANIYDSEAKMRKYIATGALADGQQAQTSTDAAATNVEDLLKFEKNTFLLINNTFSIYFSYIFL